MASGPIRLTRGAYRARGARVAKRGHALGGTQVPSSPPTHPSRWQPAASATATQTSAAATAAAA